MLCLCGFEQYSSWVPLSLRAADVQVVASFPPEKNSGSETRVEKSVCSPQAMD